LQDELGDLMVIWAHDPVLRNPRVTIIQRHVSDEPWG